MNIRAPVRARMFVSEQGLFCARLLAVLPVSFQGLGEGELALLVSDSLKFFLLGCVLL